MALTGLQHEVNAMYHLGTLKAGGTPSTDQQAAFLILLNEFLEGLQLEGALGETTTTAITGKSDGTTISTAGVLTHTNVGGTTTTIRTPVAVSTYATTGTTNTYPVGWDEMIDYGLAVAIAGAQGAAISDTVIANADRTRAMVMKAVGKVQEVQSAT
jgi:hypothetical protein